MQNLLDIHVSNALEKGIMTGKARILIADDEPHIRRILQFLLEQEGFEVAMAEDGEKALEITPEFQPDLMLLDVMMPRMDGFAVLEHIRADFKTRNLPVIMLTAKGDESDKVRGLRTGANDYILKPFSHDELLLRVSNLLDSTQQGREANPLTGLPGNRAIEREITSRIGENGGFGFMYIDIDRFKSFNDYYGYARGDQAISYLTSVLVGCSHKFGSGNDFIGHVGGDDFVLITSVDCAEGLACEIIEQFDDGLGKIHDEEDYQKGYLSVKGRTGDLVNHPLITLTVALVADTDGQFAHPAELSDTMAELKRMGKTMTNSVVVKDRRSTSELPVLVLPGGASSEITDS
jgi:diguanylate cyclase (GGDEF)-like protein